jgi:hypothetical protein
MAGPVKTERKKKIAFITAEKNNNIDVSIKEKEKEKPEGVVAVGCENHEPPSQIMTISNPN